MNNTQNQSGATVSESDSKDFQFLFSNYQLSDEEQNWCKRFERISGLEPIFTNDVKDRRGFIDMAKQNNRHIQDIADDVVNNSEHIMYALSYYDDVMYGEFDNQ